MPAQVTLQFRDETKAKLDDLIGSFRKVDVAVVHLNTDMDALVDQYKRLSKESRAMIQEGLKGFGKANGNPKSGQPAAVGGSGLAASALGWAASVWAAWQGLQSAREKVRELAESGDEGMKQLEKSFQDVNDSLDGMYSRLVSSNGQLTNLGKGVKALAEIPEFFADMAAGLKEGEAHMMKMNRMNKDLLGAADAQFKHQQAVAKIQEQRNIPALQAQLKLQTQLIKELEGKGFMSQQAAAHMAEQRLAILNQIKTVEKESADARLKQIEEQRAAEQQRVEANNAWVKQQVAEANKHARDLGQAERDIALDNRNFARDLMRGIFQDRIDQADRIKDAEKTTLKERADAEKEIIRSMKDQHALRMKQLKDEAAVSARNAADDIARMRIVAKLQVQLQTERMVFGRMLAQRQIVEAKTVADKKLAIEKELMDKQKALLLDKDKGDIGRQLFNQDPRAVRERFVSTQVNRARGAAQQSGRGFNRDHERAVRARAMREFQAGRFLGRGRGTSPEDVAQFRKDILGATIGAANKNINVLRQQGKLNADQIKALTTVGNELIKQEKELIDQQQWVDQLQRQMNALQGRRSRSRSQSTRQ